MAQASFQRRCIKPLLRVLYNETLERRGALSRGFFCPPAGRSWGGRSTGPSSLRGYVRVRRETQQRAARGPASPARPAQVGPGELSMNRTRIAARGSGAWSTSVATRCPWRSAAEPRAGRPRPTRLTPAGRADLARAIEPLHAEVFGNHGEGKELGQTATTRSSWRVRVAMTAPLAPPASSRLRAGRVATARRSEAGRSRSKRSSAMPRPSERYMRLAVRSGHEMPAFAWIGSRVRDECGARSHHEREHPPKAKRTAPSRNRRQPKPHRPPRCGPDRSRPRFRHAEVTSR